MIINEEKFGKKIAEQKRISRIINSAPNFSEIKEDLLVKYVRLGNDLALVWSDFKCENPDCQKETDLTFHHLINRNGFRFIDMKKFFTQRHYFFNIAILCADCHCLIHKFDRVERMKTITQKKLDTVKFRYQN